MSPPQMAVAVGPPERAIVVASSVGAITSFSSVRVVIVVPSEERASHVSPQCMLQCSHLYKMVCHLVPCFFM